MKRRGFVLLEAMLAVAIFAIGVISLGRCLNNCMAADRLKRRDALAGQALENRMVEIEAGAVDLDSTAAQALKSPFDGMKSKQTIVPLKMKNEKNQDLSGLYSVTLNLAWTSSEIPTRKRSRFMCFRPSNKSSRGFTLIEVITATMIVAMLSFTLYRFLTTQLYAIHTAQEVVNYCESLDAVARFLQARLGEMPPKGQNELLGQANQFHGQPSDEITWLCWGGQGVLTSAAQGQYRVTLAVQPVSETSKELELGLRRERIDANAQRDVAFYARGTAGQKYNWLPLMHPMAAMEIRYYDPRLNSWQDRWTDPQNYPSLVQLRLWKRADDAPLEVVLPVPAARMQR